MPKRNITVHGLSGQVIMLLNEIVRRLLQPASKSVMLAPVTDLARSKADLIAENALLRQQLAILRRQTPRPRLTATDRLSLLFLSKIVKTWQQALVIVQPATLLRWHREGFRLLWRLKSKAGKVRPGLPQTTIDLIQRMGTENPLWGAERIRGELLKVGKKVAKRRLPSAVFRSICARRATDPRPARTGLHS